MTSINGGSRVVTLTPMTSTKVIPTTPTNDNNNPSFLAMSSEMENELERRREEWEKEVEKMSEDFFQVNKVNNQNDLNSKVNKTLDIQLSPAHMAGQISDSARSSRPDEISEIGNAKTSYEERGGNGDRVIKFEFDMHGFDPRGINVKAQGNRILVTAKVEMEVAPGNKRTRQFTRQVDIPTNVDANELVAKMSSTGVLSVEAPFTGPQSPHPAIEPPSYPGLDQNDDIYFVTRSTPKEEHNYRQFHDSSPYSTDRYNLHSNVVTTNERITAPPIRSSPRGGGGSVEKVVTTTYRAPEPVKVSRFYSNYKDPGPLLPHSRGEILRNQSRKDYMNHTKVSRAPSPVFYRHTPSVTTTTYRENLNGYSSSPSTSYVPANNGRIAELSVNTNYSPRMESSTNLNYSSTGSSSMQNNKTPQKPKVQIIREYDTSLNGDGVAQESITQMSPPVRTSIFRDYGSASSPTRELKSSSSQPNYSRERHESTSSGERIITPTKYKKRTTQAMSQGSSDDSETSSSLSTSPPPREINPRQLFVNTNMSSSSFGNRRENSPRQVFTTTPSPTMREMNSRQVFSSISSSPPFKDLSPQRGSFFPPTSPLSNKNITLDAFDPPLSPNPTKSSHPNIITTEEGQRLKMHIDIGTGYNAEEITVHLHFKKVAIRALREEIIGGRTSRSEFSREFDLPAPLEPDTVRAALSGNGKLFVGGSLATNLYHHKVLDLVLCDMPTNGRACTVRL